MYNCLKKLMISLISIFHLSLNPNLGSITYAWTLMHWFQTLPWYLSTTHILHVFWWDKGVEGSMCGLSNNAQKSKGIETSFATNFNSQCHLSPRKLWFSKSKHMGNSTRTHVNSMEGSPYTHTTYNTNKHMLMFI